MRIFLINPNRFRPFIPPIGLDYLYDSVKDLGHEIRLFDGVKHRLPKIKKFIQHEQPDIIGISVRNLDDVNLMKKEEFITPLKKLIRFIREFSEAKVVLGGVGFSMMPLELMLETQADFGIVGDGECTFPTLLEHLDQPERVPNLLYQSAEDSQIVQTESCVYQMDRLPRFSRSLVEYTTYLQQGCAVNIQTARGCNKHCIYCCEPVVTGTTIRKRSAASVVEELSILKSYGFQDKIFIVDSEFNLDLEHTYTIVKAILDSGLDIKWSCSMTPKNVDRDLLQLMKRAGCEMLVWSVDSASEKMLHHLRKDFSVSDMLHVCHISREINLSQCYIFLFGGPGESLQTIDESYTNIKNIQEAMLGFSVGLRIYPQTALEEIALTEGEIPETRNLLYPHYYQEERMKKSLLPYVTEKFSSLKNSFTYNSGLDKHVEQEVSKVFTLPKSAH